MLKPLVSIAMTTYNGEKFLREQLNSILSQTYENIEIVICDDCSTDNTVKLLEEYRVNHGIEYHVNNKNLGYIKNFERVLGFCSGDYIALSDQDDIWLNNKIELLVENLGDSPLIFSDASLVNTNGVIFEESFQRYQNIIVPEHSEQFRYLLFRNFVTGCTVLFKREVLENAVPFIDSIPHDWWIALNASVIGNIKNIKIPLVLYRQHQNNTIGAKKRVKNSISKIQPVKRKLKILKTINNSYKILNSLKLRYSGSDKMMIISTIDKDYDIYRNSIMKKNPIHFSAFLIAWKYRKIWYNNYPMIYALAKLIV